MIPKIYNLVSFDISIYPCNHHHKLMIGSGLPNSFTTLYPSLLLLPNHHSIPRATNDLLSVTTYWFTFSRIQYTLNHIVKLSSFFWGGWVQCLDSYTQLFFYWNSHFYTCKCFTTLTFLFFLFWLHHSIGSSQGRGQNSFLHIWKVILVNIVLYIFFVFEHFNYLSSLCNSPNL